MLRRPSSATRLCLHQAAECERPPSTSPPERASRSVFTIFRSGWNQFRRWAFRANLMARFPSPKANLPSGRDPGLRRGRGFGWSAAVVSGRGGAEPRQRPSGPRADRRSIGIRRAAVFGLRLRGEAHPQLGHLEQDSLLMRQRVARHPPAFLRKYPICFRFTHYLQLRLAIRGLLSRLR